MFRATGRFQSGERFTARIPAGGFPEAVARLTNALDGSAGDVESLTLKRVPEKFSLRKRAASTDSTSSDKRRGGKAKK